MTPAARIQAAIELMAEILATPKPADGMVSAYFRTRRFIGSKDRQAINNRLWRVMREYHRLKWWIEKSGGAADARGFVIADLAFEEKLGVSAMDDAFSGGKYAPEPMTREERTLAAALQGKELESPDMPLQARAECPDWAFEALQKALGADFEKEMRAMQPAAPLDLRVNTLKTSRKDVLDQLREDGFDAHEGKVSPLCVRVLGRPQIAQHFLFQEGFVEIQDQGSQMVAVLADAKPGEQVADFCAGAGGKTLAMGASMDNKGRIVALDVMGGRLNRAKERFRRAGLHNIETRELSGEGDKFVKRHVGHFDLVLVDAPCSGTGTWRRDPDKRWRQLGPTLAALVPLQKEILENAHRIVKPGGRLVYATCSLLPEENDTQIEEFLKAHPEFTLKQDMHLSPAKDDTDGFFAAVMVRKAIA
jgi:16S rRNA (cytosine967-C5)-methyltransferase